MKMNQSASPRHASSQVAAISIDVNGRNLGTPLQIDHDLNEPHPSDSSARKLLHIRVRLSASALADTGTADDLIGPAGMSLLTEPIAASRLSQRLFPLENTDEAAHHLDRHSGPRLFLPRRRGE